MPGEVVVTGIGAVGAWGAGRSELGAVLATPEVAVAAPDLKRWVPPAAARRMSRPSKLAVAAGRMALEDAGAEERGADAEATAIFLGSAFGSVAFTERLVCQIFDEGPEAAQPFLFSECVANAPAGQLAIASGARGANVTITQREVSALVAVGRASAEIREGRAGRALAGAVEEITPLLRSILNRFGALARPEAGGAPVARPFDRDRSGFVSEDGATLLLLEDEETARRRGAVPLARVRASGSAFDPTSTASDWGCGAEALGTSLGRGLDRAGIERRGIDVIVSGGSGSRRGDRLEAGMLRACWGGLPLPPVLAPKGTLGEYAGGTIGPGVLAVSGGAFGPTPGFRTSDPELEIEPFDGRGSRDWRRALLTGVAAGGSAAWVVLERP